MEADWSRRAFNNEPVPKEYYDKPEPSQADQYYTMAWNDLSTERPIGFGLGQIPRSKIKQYGIDDLALGGDELDFFVKVIRRCDDLYVASKSTTKSSDPKMLDEVPPSDVEGTRSLLRRLAKPKNSPDRFVAKKPRLKDKT